MSRRLFVMGMFRSGTTLFSRLLHAHGDVVCASDPFRQYYLALVNHVKKDVEADLSGFDPLDYPDEAQLQLFDAVQEATLDRPFPDGWRDSLYERIIPEAEPKSPKFTDHFEEVRGDTFREVFEHLWSRVSEAYADGDEAWVATKEVETTKLTPVLARTFPDSKFLHIVRDPRAVCASKNVRENDKSPWLILTRQWRKLATLSYCYEQRFPERVHVVRYEDLVQSPRETVTGICEFLDVEMDETTLDPSNFVDGAGEQWLQNTSHGESSASFDTSAIDKWRDVLADREAEYVEQLCYATMRTYGYEPDSSFGLSADMLFDPPQVERDQLEDWYAKSYGGWSHLDHVDATATERVRQQLLTADDETFDAVDETLLKGFFHDVEYAATVREAVDLPDT